MLEKMDKGLEELIAAGEAILQNRKLNKDYDLSLISIPKTYPINHPIADHSGNGSYTCLNMPQPRSDYQLANGISSQKKESSLTLDLSTVCTYKKIAQDDVNEKETLLSRNSSDLPINRPTQQWYPWSSSEREPIHRLSNSNDSGYNAGSEANVISQLITDMSSSNQSDSDSSLLLLKNECASIFSLSLSMSSSLANANRLLGQLIKSQTLSSKFEESLLNEVKSCETNCKENEMQLDHAASKINLLLAKISDAYYQADEFKGILNSIQEQSLSLIKLTEDLLVKNGLKHLVPAIEVKRIGSLRVLEEVHLGLMLLSGEAPNQHLQIQNDHLNEMTILREQLEQKIKVLHSELSSVNENKTKQIINLEIQLEKKTKDMTELQFQNEFNEREKVSFEKSYQKQLQHSEEANTNLRHQIIQIKQETDKKLAEILCKDVVKCDANKDFAAEISSLKNQIKLQEQQIMNLEGEKKSLWESKRIAEKKNQEEKKLAKSELYNAREAQISLVNKLKRLEEEMEEKEKAKTSVESIVLKLKDSIAVLKEAHEEEICEFQKKIDCNNDDICEKCSKIRSLEVHLMQTNTELELERQRVLTLSAETDLLSKQIDKLQENMKKIMLFCPREIRVTSGLNIPGTPNEQSTVSMLLEESQRREEKLQLLLKQKDEQMKELQESISYEITNKNKELELLSESVETLESEMKDVVSSLNVSTGMFEASQRAKTLLNSRSDHIENLQDEVARLSFGGQTFSEDQSSIIEDLQEKLADAKKAVRNAREEARKERLMAAQLRQQLAFLQIDLDSAREASRYLSCHPRSSFGNISSLQIEDGGAIQDNISIKSPSFLSS